jgi:WD40 repeat protein
LWEYRTTVSFSPDERLIVTGTSVMKSASSAKADETTVEKPSSLVLLNADTLKLEKRVGFSSNGVICTLWSGKLNQVVVGLADGKVKVLYSPEKSIKGIKLCATRAPPRRDPLDDFVFEPEFVRTLSPLV